MLWKIAKKEFLLNLMTFKFVVGTILCIVLMAVFMPVLAGDYQQRLKTYNKNVADNEAELRKVKVYKNITPTVYRPPSLMSVFSEGLEKRLGKSAQIHLRSVPEINAAPAKINPYLSMFPNIDVSLIFKIVMSILTALMAYDVISGERERGTLKLILSGTIPRYQVLLGKLLSGLMTLIVPVTISFIVGLLILLFFPMVDLAGTDWIRIVLMYIVSLIFISAMYNFGMLFSCITKRSATSLMFVLLFWVIFVTVIPNISGFLAAHIQPLEPKERINTEIKSLWGQFDVEMGQHQQENPRRGDRSSVRGAFGGMYWPVCNTAWIERHQKLFAFQEPLRIRYADKVAQIQRSYLDKLYKQQNLTANLSRISLISVYGNVMSALAGTDATSSESFIDNVKAHRNRIIDFLRSETDNFSMPSYFTTTDGSDWDQLDSFFEKYVQTRNQLDREEAVKKFTDWTKKKAAQDPPINLQNLSKFSFKQQNILETIKRTIPDMFLLMFANMLFFLMSFVIFLRYDVR